MGNVRLVRLEPAIEQALENDATYREALTREDWDLLAEAMQRVIGRALPTPPAGVQEPHWGGYATVDESTGDVVGSCAFKGPPGEDGVVEIAYFTYPGFEGRGYATWMARELIELASKAAAHLVIAHTLPEVNPSTRVLEKVGMTFVGEVMDPDDGRVWRWERQIGV